MYKRLTRFTVGVFSVVVAASFLGLTFKKTVKEPPTSSLNPQVKGESIQSSETQESMAELTEPTQFDALGEASWDCSKDIYDCSSFENQEQAQLLFDFCKNTVGDVHHLDPDDDSIACN